MQPLSSKCPEAVFGREHECEKLYTLLEQEPSAIQVILGPCNSGKTKLQYGLRNRSDLTAALPTWMVDRLQTIFIRPKALLGR